MLQIATIWGIIPPWKAGKSSTQTRVLGRKKVIPHPNHPWRQILLYQWTKRLASRIPNHVSSLHPSGIDSSGRISMISPRKVHGWVDICKKKYGFHGLQHGRSFHNIHSVLTLNFLSWALVSTAVKFIRMTCKVDLEQVTAERTGTLFHNMESFL